MNKSASGLEEEIGRPWQSWRGCVFGGSFALLAIILSSCATQKGGGVRSAEPPWRWISSTQAGAWKEMPLVTEPTLVLDPEPDQPSRTNTLQLDAKTTFQTMDGFGGCFNDLGWQALQA